METPSPEVFEKLSAFYLGREYDLAAGEQREGLLLYDSKDLRTHALCVGMTGSGKTGLCVSLLEEAAIDGIPALIIDPKGELGNLMLNFPDLKPESFAPWVDPEEARRKGLSPEEYAAEQAELWRKGLASWGEGGERMRRLKEAAEVRIYTPGSDAGLPVSILSSFGAPPPEIAEDGDLFRDRIHSLTTSLLDLLGIDADPVRSREYILLSNLLDAVWKQGCDMDLAGLIQTVQNPPIRKVGVMDLEAFFPARDRFGLAMALNNLLAAPTFQGWTAGEPLDIDKMLYTPNAKPRVTIFSIAHLSEPERMFFVSLLLNQTLSWMRTRPGTSSLRALLYMDEIFGYMPPVAEPPSKRPLLTLLKQARAYGLGVVLATQNPVDLDYKALSNIGTWFLGRLQTERDKNRVLDGLEGAAAGSGGFDRGRMEEILAGLGKRVFLLHNVHENQPAVFHTRWAMSYLRGPLTRLEIKKLMDGSREATPPPVAPAPAAAPAGPAVPAAKAAQSPRPILPPGVPQVFLPPKDPGGSGQRVFVPRLVGSAKVHFVDRRRGIEHSERVTLIHHLDDSGVVDWYRAEEVDLARDDLASKPPGEGSYSPAPSPASRPKSYAQWKKNLSDHLYRERRVELFKSPTFGEVSRPGEAERDFRIRLGDLGREKRDQAVDKLRESYTKKLDRLEVRIRRAEHAVERESEQAKQHKMSTVISLGATLLSAFVGRKILRSGTVGRASTAARTLSRGAKERQDVERAEENLDALRMEEQELNDKLQQDLDDLTERFDPLREELETMTLRPRRTDVKISVLALAWES